MIPKNRGKVAVEASLQAVGNMNVKAQGAKVRDFHKFQLKNGLTVLLKESHKSPVVSVQMWVRTGSADEVKGEEGISHFIEHLVFKGTTKFDVGEIAATVEAAGGEINAYTTFDQTVFYITISKEFDTTAMDVISQMMGYPTFDAQEIDNEREVVLEEIKRGNDSLSRQASQLLFSTTFPKHPYGIPVIGYDRVVKKLSRKKIINYFQSRYNPANMFLVVSGDIDVAKTKKQIAAYFGHIAPRKLRKVARKKDKKQLNPRIKVAKSQFEESQFYLSWQIPGTLHKDIPALDVLSLILGQGESSRLYQRLRMEKHLVNSSYATSYTPSDCGLFAISVSLNGNKFDSVLAELKNVWNELLINPPSKEEMEKAINNFRSEQFYSMETVDGLARKLGSTYLLAKDPLFFDKYLKQVEKLKPSDLVRVARKYLTAKNVNFSMMVNGNPKDFEKRAKSWIAEQQKNHKKLPPIKIPKNERVQLKKASAVRRAKVEDQVIVEKIPGGGTLLIRPNYDTPVISLRMGFLGGLRLEDPQRLGTTELLSRVWTAGTKTRTETELQTEIDRLASSLGAFGGRNTIGLSTETLDENQDRIFELFEDVWVNPAFSPTIIEREKHLMLEQLKTRKDNPGQIASLLFLQNMFPGHPYSWDMLGTEQTLAKLTADDLRQHLQHSQNRENMVVSVSGSVDVDKVKAMISSGASQITNGQKLNKQISYNSPSQDVRVFEKAEKQQSHIIYGFRGLSFTSHERFALQVMQSVLAGQGGRLFVELRDKASLAYSVAPMRMEGIENGYFGAYIGCSPEKGQQAISMMRAEFDKLIGQPISQYELDRAKRYLIGRHDIDLQRNSAIASSMLFDELYNVGYEEVFKFADEVRAVTTEQVQKLAQRLFTQPSVIAAVGPVKPW